MRVICTAKTSSNPQRETISCHVQAKTYQLVSKHQHSLQAELPVAKIEQVLQAGAKQVQHHDIVVAFYSIPSDVWYASCKDALN